MRNKLKTAEALEAALARIIGGTPLRIDPGRPLSIKSVADEAGIAPSTIHTRHPDFLDKLRRLISPTKGKPQRSPEISSEIDSLRNANRRLREELSELRDLLAKMASENARLEIDLIDLKAGMAKGKILSHPLNPGGN